MKIRKFTYGLLLALALPLTACRDDADDLMQPEAPQPEGRTVLAYIWGDVTGGNGILLSECQLDYINKMEAGWDDSYSGSLYVYLDPSPNFVQFDTPVLLKIKHDNTPAIVSEVVKVYEPIEEHGDVDRYPEVQNDVRALAPATSYGLMLFGHGSGVMPIGKKDDIEIDSRGMGGDTKKYLENREIATLTLPDYEL